MLASHTGFPPLQKYMYEKNQGSVIQNTMEKVIAAIRVGGVAVTPGTTSTLKPSAAISNRRAKFS